MVAAAVIRAAALARGTVVDLAVVIRRAGDRLRTDDLIDGDADHPEMAGGEDPALDEGFDLGVHGARSLLPDLIPMLALGVVDLGLLVQRLASGGTILTRRNR